MKTPVRIARAGNAISLPADPAYTQQLANVLRYTHRTHFNGPELYARKRQKAADPSSIVRPEFEDEVRDLFAINGDEIVAAAGMMGRIWSVLSNMGYAPVFDDLRKIKLPPADYSRLSRITGFEMRFKVAELLTTVDACYGGVLHLPTGMGKTMAIVALCAVYPTSRIAIVSPGVDLLRSTKDRLTKCLNEYPGVIGNGECVTDSRITLCSADSLHKLPMHKQALIIYDEVHTAATPKRIQALTSQFTEAKMIGASASIDQRADNADALIEAVFGPVVLSVTYEEAAEAGSVARVRVLPVIVPEIHNFESRLPKDPSARKRMAYTLNELRNATIARVAQAADTLVGIPDSQVLIMGETVEHLFEIAHRLPDYRVVYAGMSETIMGRLALRGRIDADFKPITPVERAAVLRGFEANEIKKVVANHCWKQGIDPRHLNVMIRADGGTSEINSTQIPGRLSRIVDGKPAGLLIDFVDSFSKWTRARWLKRLQSYRDLGFEILEPIAI